MDFYFDPAYAGLYATENEEVGTFEYECEYGKLVNLFIKRPIKRLIDGEQYYDITTPYGYGGPLIVRTTDAAALMRQYQKAFEQYCRDNRIVCEFIRFHLYDNADVRQHFYGEIAYVLDNVVVNTASDYEMIKAGYDRNIRWSINKAHRNELVLIAENNGDRLDDFLEIYYQTMDRNNATAYYYFKREFFEKIIAEMPENFMFFYVLKDAVAISTELVLCSEKYAYSFLGGTVRECYSLRPNEFLKDGIIQWCNRTGREKFILGGGYHKDDGIYKYKRNFTPDPDVPFYVGKAIYDPVVYEKLVAARKAETDSFDEASSYFPLYRA